MFAFSFDIFLTTVAVTVVAMLVLGFSNCLVSGRSVVCCYDFCCDDAFDYYIFNDEKHDFCTDVGRANGICDADASVVRR